jgi:hypothetical protein
MGNNIIKKNVPLIWRPSLSLFLFTIHVDFRDAPQNSLIDSTTNPKVKTMKGNGVGIHSLIHKILGVKGHVEASG